MILEALQHLLTPAPPEVRALGYLREAIAIEARFKRCRADWADHLAHCKAMICQSTAGLVPGSRVLIIGSGALHDVPVEELLKQGLQLILLDIIHLPKIRRAYKNHPQVAFVTRDVTGLARCLHDKQSLTAADIERAPDGLPAADLVISLNILSQLPITLCTHAQRHALPLPDDFAAQVMNAHLTLLRRTAPDHLLICDIQRRYLAADEVVAREEALPTALSTALGTPAVDWIWRIAPKGEIDGKIALHHQVACWRSQV